MAGVSRTTQLAKLSRPRLYDALPRERLFKLLDKAAERPAVWIAAPPGAGKTTLVAGWLESRARSGIWCQVDGGDADPASFFYYLGIAERARIGRSKKLRPLPLLTPEHLADVPGFARRFFRELFDRLGASAVLVLDNFQEAGGASALHDIARIAIENAPAGVSIVIVSRTVPGEDFALPSANRLLTLIEWEPLKLTREESGRIAQLHAPISDSLLDELHERSGGWAVGLILLAERLRRGAGIEDLSAPDSLQEVFGYFAGQLFDRSDADNRRMLMQLSYLPNISASMAEALTGNASVLKLLDHLYRRHLFTNRRAGKEPVYQFHALFRAFLKHCAKTDLDAGQQKFVATHAAQLLDAAGQFEDSMDLRLAAQDWTGAEELILTQARAFIAQGRWRNVVDWIGALPEQRVEQDCWLLHWLGTAWIGVDPARARSILERACQQAKRNGDVLCQVQTAAGMVEAYFLEYAVFTPLDRWIPVLERMFEPQVRAMEPNAELRAQSAMLIALVYRMPDHKRIDQCVVRVDELLRTDADVNLRVTAATHLTLYGSFTGHLQVSRRAAAVLTPLLADPAVTVFRRIFAWAVINWYACNASDVSLGEQAIASNLSIASAEGMHIAERFACIIGFYFDLDQRRIESARRRLERFEEIMIPEQPYEAASLVNMKSWFGLHTGDPAPALIHGEKAYELYVEAGSVPHIFMPLASLIWANVESGDFIAGRRWIEEHRRSSDRVNMEWARFALDAAEAIMALRQGDLLVLDDRLNRIFAHERHRMDQYGHMLAWWRGWAGILAATALERGIQIQRAIAFIRTFGLEAPEQYLETWPWPVKVRCLGQFDIFVEDRLLDYGNKPPRKLLALLKAIIALGSRDVPEHKLIDALWPEEDGDTAHQSFTTALHRLRKLLGDNSLIRQREGRISLDTSRVWVDTLAFEALGSHEGDADLSVVIKAIGLYRGEFLPNEDAPWAFSMREKLRGRYLELVSSTARRLEQEGRLEEALDLYRRGIEADELAETFHQGLMRCHHQIGRTPEALDAYRRMRELLSRVHGVQPSAATEELYRKLSSR
ncbi:MAG: BTAD domain-containing putative transcriptional regulator [Betaproteobacteria bacterium]|jgi:LuxR family maltose regulon positive regulatory protein